jgi:deoxyribodipyrimidine photo-lyase
MINQRARLIKEGKKGKGPVIYWMSRDQRMHDNWALLYAQILALMQKSPLVVVFCLVPNFLEATIRQYGFMLRGLKELEADLHKKNISFVLAAGKPGEQIPRQVKKFEAACLITDFDPLKIKRKWKAEAAKKIDVPFHEVDAHNIVPCWIASPKQEYAAYTFRPKVLRLLPDFLERFPLIKKHPFSLKGKQALIKWQNVHSSLRVDRDVKEVEWLKPGEQAAKKVLKKFLEKKLPSYETERNDPTLDGQSNLSPYLHFGQISAQRIAMSVQESNATTKDKDAFLEELIVRRELSDNFCFYNENYDSFNGFPSWAKESLDKQRKKPREYVYPLKQFENAGTHDQLWNAAQQEMLTRGKMHGYMRMYWAKKILEWTESPERAIEIAIYLNDKYELDGRDTNGYTGIAWSIGGVHDRAWNERAVFGKIRYMSYNGCKGKFDVKKYIDRYNSYTT